VATESESKLERRVRRAAETALAERKFVTSIDVLAGMGWLERGKRARRSGPS
jgi:hypothetical protein